VHVRQRHLRTVRPIEAILHVAGKFSPETIALWERLADYLAVALAKAQAEESLQEAYENLQAQSEETLRESEERCRAFFENSIDAVLLTAPDGTIYEVNPEACRIFGMTEEEIIRGEEIKL
jgi:PAS domain-containing protein